MGTKNIITINSGSSSCKLALFGYDESSRVPELIAEMYVADIGQHLIKVKISWSDGREEHYDKSSEDSNTASTIISDWLRDIADKYPVSGFGHRFVHGGDSHSRPELLTRFLREKLAIMAEFDAIHALPALNFIDSMSQLYPDVPQVICFDTGFFSDLPEVATTLPLPRVLRERGVRRYGFHGLSYQYAQRAFSDYAGSVARDGRVIYAHLGSGCSLTATLGGKPVDTTMSFSPTSGVVMSSRSGDIDPMIAEFASKSLGIDNSTYADLVSRQSGLLGISERTADMKELLDVENEDPKAKLAVEVFCHTIRKSIASLSAVTQGIDSLVFTGTIGEQSFILRQRICTQLAYLGIELDPEKNNNSQQTISSDGSRVGVHVIPTNEVRIIAEAVINEL